MSVIVAYMSVWCLMLMYRNVFVQVWVGAGTRILVPVELPAGVSLHWKFVSEPKVR